MKDVPWWAVLAWAACEAPFMVLAFLCLFDAAGGSRLVRAYDEEWRPVHLLAELILGVTAFLAAVGVAYFFDWAWRG